MVMSKNILAKKGADAYKDLAVCYTGGPRQSTRQYGNVKKYFGKKGIHIRDTLV